MISQHHQFVRKLRTTNTRLYHVIRLDGIVHIDFKVDANVATQVIP